MVMVLSLYMIVLMLSMGWQLQMWSSPSTFTSESARVKPGIMITSAGRGYP